MKLLDQCCTLQQAKRLKDLGITGPSLWCHFKAPSHAGLVLAEMKVRHVWILTGNPYDEENIEFTPVFTVAELGVMLPAGYDTMYCTNDGWRGYDLDDNDFSPKPYEYEAQLRADMVIRLIESKDLDVNEVNQRLQNS